MTGIIGETKLVFLEIYRKGLPTKGKKLSEKFLNSPIIPENPLVVIEPSKDWFNLNLRDLWHYRDLLYILTARDIKVRYKQTILGAGWVIIQPLFTVLVFTLFFGKLAAMPSDDIPYPLFAFAGLLPWGFFSNAVTKSVTSLVTNSNLITKVYFPRMIIPVSSVIGGLLDFFIAFIFLTAMMIYFQIGFSLNLLMLPVLVLLMSVLALSLGMWLAGLNVKYRDVGQAIPFLIQIGFFLSPIIYPLSLVPERWRWIMALNPVTGLIEGFRSALFGKPFDWFSLIFSGVITLTIFIVAVYSFRRMEDDFADVI
ncbi:MAG: ABC transporter permease [Acidobacteriota bacterium]